MEGKKTFHTTAILLAGGSGKRMQSKVAKQFLEIGGHPLIWYSLKCFQDSPLIDDIVIVTSAGAVDYCRDTFCSSGCFTKVKAVARGGRERYDSVYAGLCACGPADYVLIHDSARPFIDGEILERLVDQVRKNRACVAGMPSKDTVNLVDDNGQVLDTPDRSGVWIVQTPQAFEYSLIRRAHEILREKPGGLDGITDDAMVLKRALGISSYMVRGSYRNLKVTTPEDLLTAEALLSI